MRLIRSLRASRDGRAWLVAWAAAALILLVTVTPALAARGPSRLSDPAISPMAATAGVPVTFEVT